MTKNEFEGVFGKALEEATLAAESILGADMPRDFEYELHGQGYSGSSISRQESISALYIDADRFIPVIDVGITAVDFNSGKVVVFVGASGRQLVSFDRTWNDPPGMGPFKVIVPAKVRLLGED